LKSPPKISLIRWIFGLFIWSKWKLFSANDEIYVIAQNKRLAIECLDSFHSSESKRIVKQISPLTRIYIQRPMQGDDVWWFSVLNDHALLDKKNVYTFFLKHYESDKAFVIYLNK
jgi:hypothetical protein